MTREHSGIRYTQSTIKDSKHDECENNKDGYAPNRYRKRLQYKSIEKATNILNAEVDKNHLQRRNKIGSIREIRTIGAVPEIPQNNAGMPDVETILDRFRSRHPPAVRKRLLFWSGTGIEKARKFAKDHYLRILEDLTEGHYDKWALKELPGADEDANWALQYPMWVRLSLAFAEFADGEVSVMIQGYKQGERLNSIWNAYERPVLRSRNIKINWFDGDGTRTGPRYPTRFVLEYGQYNFPIHGHPNQPTSHKPQQQKNYQGSAKEQAKSYATTSFRHDGPVNL